MWELLHEFGLGPEVLFVLVLIVLLGLPMFLPYVVCPLVGSLVVAVGALPYVGVAIVDSVCFLDICPDCHSLLLQYQRLVLLLFVRPFLLIV